MKLSDAKKTLATMHRHFGGDWNDALQTLGWTLRQVARITRGKEFGPEGFGDHEIMKDIQDCWPEDDL